MRKHVRRLVLPALVVGLAVTFLPASSAAQSVSDLVREGTRLERAGEFDDSLALFRKAVAADPSSFDAQYALGRSLDLAGRYVEAREHLQAALALAGSGARDLVLSALAVSHAFEGDARAAAPYYERQFAAQAQGDPATAAATANALARVYLEAGHPDEAEAWYRKGYETGLAAPGLTPAQKDLWEFRWENAVGRIAARRGRMDEARAAAARARAVLDRGTNADQEPFYPYLVGYIAFFAGDYRTAIDELSGGDLDDPFVAGLVARAWEKLGDASRAREYFQRVMASNAHSINAAFSRPLARAFLAR